MPDTTIVGTPDAPPEAKNQFERIVDNIEAFIEKVDMNKVMRALRVLLKIAKIVFPKFVPMNADERQLYDDIVGTADEILNPK